MRIAVTGASTDTGRRLCERLLEQGHRVVCFGGSRHRNVQEGEAGGHAVAPGAELILGRLPEPGSSWGEHGEKFDEVLQGAALVYHLAHVRYAPAVVERARAAGVLRTVCVSSARRFTRWEDAATREVIAAEETLARAPEGWVALRSTMIYGGGHDRNIARLVGIVRRWPVILLPGGGKNLVQPLFVDDLAEALLAAGHAHDVAGKVIDVAGPEPLTQREVLESIARALGKRPALIPIPLGPARGLAWLGGKGMRDRVRRMGEDRAVAIEEARRLLGFEPRPFTHGLREVLARQFKTHIEGASGWGSGSE
jgi:nucleoside-diphosphate-sugar epimerase